MGILVLDHHGIGDVITTLPLLDTLRCGYPSEAIDVVVKSSIEAAIVQTTGVRRSIEFHRESMRSVDWAVFFARLVGRYRMLVATANTNSKLANRLGRAALVRTRIGHGPSGGPFTHNVPRTGAHKVDENLDIARALALPLADRIPVLRLPASVVGPTVHSTLPIVVLHVATGILVGSKRFDMSIANYKELSLRFWVDVLLAAHERFGALTWIAVGGSREKELIASLRTHLPHDLDLRDCAATLSILETAGVIKGARAFVGGDSGLAHVAAAVDTPVVAVFGPTDPAITGPVGRAVDVLQGKSCPLAPCYPQRIYQCEWSAPDVLRVGFETRRCLNEVDPQRVVQALGRHLASDARYRSSAGGRSGN